MMVTILQRKRGQQTDIIGAFKNNIRTKKNTYMVSACPFFAFCQPGVQNIILCEIEELINNIEYVRRIKIYSLLRMKKIK
jgi:hypothetical protein